MIYLFISPHSDDVAVACGATVAKLAENPENEVHLMILSLAEKSNTAFMSGELRQECHEAYTSLGIIEENITYWEFPVREFEAHRQLLLETFCQTRKDLEPDVVFIPPQRDLHQDHATTSIEAVRAFRKHASIYGYDVFWHPRSCGDPDTYIEITGVELSLKLIAVDCFYSQVAKKSKCVQSYYITANARSRGVVVDLLFAEAFHSVSIRKEGNYGF